jgi:hypothetical protein
MTDVVLKGEIHTSRGDLKEERELLREGVDALVLEGEESKAEYGWSEGWFSTTSWIFGLVMSNIYTDNRVLEDLALAQDADVLYTRESNAALLRNAGRFVKWTAALLFYVLFPLSLIIGIVTGQTVTGALVLLLSSLAPLLLLRVYNMRRSEGEENTDQRMADKIVEAAEGSERVVAVMGQAHVESVKERLPENLDVEERDIAYSVWSRPHLEELITPVFTGFSVLFVFYLIAMYLYALFISLAL